MIGNLVGLLVIILVAGLFAFLAMRARRSKNGLVKWGGLVLAGLFTVLFGLLSIFTGLGMYKLYKPRGNPVQDITVARTAAEVARGEQIARTLCVGCHSKNQEMPLSGGKDMGADIPIPLGSYVPANLTPGGRIKDWSDGEIIRAIQFVATMKTGTNPTGKPLDPDQMPWKEIGRLDDVELTALYEYVKSIP